MLDKHALTFMYFGGSLREPGDQRVTGLVIGRVSIGLDVRYLSLHFGSHQNLIFGVLQMLHCHTILVVNGRS